MGLTDVIFYENKLGKHNVISGFKQIMNIPNLEEKIILNDNRWIVKERIFDYDKNVVHIVVKKISLIKAKNS